jgi:hypothetical protein
MTTRTFSAEMLTAMASSEVKVVWLAQIEFVSTTLYLSTRSWNMDWSGNTYLGNSILRAPNSIRGTKDHVSNGYVIPLVGFDSTIMSLILTELTRAKKAYVYFGMLDASNNLIADPFLAISGNFSTARILSAGRQREVQLNYENDFFTSTRVNIFRYTDQSQQALFPGDTGFQRVAYAADWKGFWGATTRPLTYQKKKRNTAK